MHRRQSHSAGRSRGTRSDGSEMAGCETSTEAEMGPERWDQWRPVVETMVKRGMISSCGGGGEEAGFV